MSVEMTDDKPAKAAVSVTQMCRLLKMSRSQFTVHSRRGIFHSPMHLASNNRPYFTASMVEDNLRARQTGIGVNGEYVLFYERSPTTPKVENKIESRVESTHLLDGLKASGLKTVTRDQVEAALMSCFPNGTADQNENTVLTVVFRHLKRSGVV
jgi:hypothetical protein